MSNRSAVKARATDNSLRLLTLCVDRSGNIFVSDYSNNRIEEFDGNGNFIQTFGNRGAVQQRLDQPIGLAIDLYGNVYAADRANQRIVEFSPNGDYIQSIGGVYGIGNGQFRGPADISFDGVGNLYVADTDNGRIVKFDFVPAAVPEPGDFALIVGVMMAGAALLRRRK